MKKTITKLLISLFCFLGYTNANAEPQKPILTVLHAGTESDSGMEFSYPTDGKAKLILAQAIFPSVQFYRCIRIHRLLWFMCCREN